MEADHWLRAIEQKFTIIQCTDEEKVNFVAHQLQEAVGAWWHDYHTRLQPNERLTWQEFKVAFHGFFIPTEAMALKATEF